MKFEEVLPALREGKKIRREDTVWKNYYGFLFISETEDKIFSDNVVNDNYRIAKKDLNSDDWEIVEEPKKVKLRDLTEEQYQKWILENCGNYNDKCEGCPFQKVYCDRNPNIDDWWIRNKDLYSDKFLDQEVEIYE